MPEGLPLAILLLVSFPAVDASYLLPAWGLSISVFLLLWTLGRAVVSSAAKQTDSANAGELSSLEISRDSRHVPFLSPSLF
jgi:hypothetical protein